MTCSQVLCIFLTRNGLSVVRADESGNRLYNEIVLGSLYIYINIVLGSSYICR